MPDWQIGVVVPGTGAGLVRCSGHVPLGGDYGEDPGHVGEPMPLGWQRFGVPPEELEEVAEDRYVWVSLLKLLPHDMIPGEAADDRWLDRPECKFVAE